VGKGSFPLIGCRRYHEPMTRITIDLPGDLLARLRWMAEEEGVSMAALVREAVENRAEWHRPTPRSLGIAASGHRDTAQRCGDRREPV